MADADAAVVPGRRVKLTPMEAAAQSQLVARQAVDAVVDAGGAALYDHYLAGREVAYSVDRCVQDMYHVLHSAYLARSEPYGDGGPPALAPGPPDTAPRDPNVPGEARGLRHDPVDSRSARVRSVASLCLPAYLLACLHLAHCAHRIAACARPPRPSSVSRPHRARR